MSCDYCPFAFNFTDSGDGECLIDVANNINVLLCAGCLPISDTIDFITTIIIYKKKHMLI